MEEAEGVEEAAGGEAEVELLLLTGEGEDEDEEASDPSPDDDEDEACAPVLDELLSLASGGPGSAEDEL